MQFCYVWRRHINKLLVSQFICTFPHCDRHTSIKYEEKQPIGIHVQCESFLPLHLEPLFPNASGPADL